MPEQAPTINLSNMDGLRTVVYDTEVVPDYIWRAAQLVHRESLRALLPADEQDRADFLVKMDDFPAYRDTRINPNRLVGNDWNDDQLFRRPKFAAIFDHTNQLVGGVLTADNSSARYLHGPLSPVEYWPKMLFPPAVKAPIIGGKRYDHLREVFTHPDAQASLEVEDDTAVVSGIAIAGIYYSIAEASPHQFLVSYVLPADPVDRELTDITEALRMSETGYRRPHTLPGFREDAKRARVEAQVGQVMRGIVERPGAQPAIKGIDVSRVTTKTIARQDRDQRRRNEREYWRDFDARQETKDWGK